MVLLGGAAPSVSVIGSSAEYLWRWYAYASAFGSLAEWAEVTAHAAEVMAHAVAVTAHAAEVTAHAAAVTADVLETVEAAAETDHALETVELETVALAASNSEARSIPFAKERYFSWHLQVQQSPHLHLPGGPASAARRWDSKLHPR